MRVAPFFEREGKTCPKKGGSEGKARHTPSNGIVRGGITLSGLHPHAGNLQMAHHTGVVITVAIDTTRRVAE